MTKRRINYAGSVHDEREIEAVVDVLQVAPPPSESDATSGTWRRGSLRSSASVAA